MHNNALWSNSNAFSLIICKVYTKRENAGSWNFGPEKATSELPILNNYKWAENLCRIVLEYMKNIGANNYRRGPPWWAQDTRACPGGLCPPWPTSGAPLLVYKSFWPRKNKERYFEPKCRRLEAWAGALLPSGGAIPSGELPSRRGKSSSSLSPTTLPSLGGQSPSTSSIAPSPLKP